MELQLVSFEQAKALKELGFPQDTRTIDTYYYDDGAFFDGNSGDYEDEYNVTETYVAPSLELAAKWLREEKNILIELTRVFGKYAGRIMELHTSGERNPRIRFQDYSSYEEALSAGIDKAIEYLKNE